MAAPKVNIISREEFSIDELKKHFLRTSKKRVSKKPAKMMLGPGIEVPPEYLLAQEKLAKTLMAGSFAIGKKPAKGVGAGRENISGIHIGQKLVRGKPTGTLAVVVCVRKKLDPKKVHAKYRIPKRIKIGDVYVPIDVKFGAAVVHPHAVGGAICGLDKPPSGEGSIGCFVFIDKPATAAQPAKRFPFLLTNNHVIGKFVLANEDDDVFEFSTFGGAAGNKIGGTLIKMGTANKVQGHSIDAAMALALENPEADLNRHTGLQFSSNIVISDSGGVQMRGAMSNKITTGKIVRVHGALDVPYAAPEFPINDTFSLKNVLEIQPTSGPVFSQAGDSGSLILTEDGDPTAILVGGPKAGQSGNSFAQDLSTIQDDLRFDGLFSVP